MVYSYIVLGDCLITFVMFMLVCVLCCQNMCVTEGLTEIASHSIVLLFYIHLS